MGLISLIHPICLLLGHDFDDRDWICRVCGKNAKK